jgi:ABC-type Fe3+ transport system substrate-binding protein
MQQLIKDADAEGTLNCVESSFCDTDFLGAVEQGMEAMYGIDISIEAGAGSFMGAMITRILEERAAGQPPVSDVLYVSGGEPFYTLSSGGGTIPDIPWKSYDPTITDEEITRDSSGIHLFADSVGIVYNTDLYSADEIPQAIEDLLDPKFDGLIATTPYGTGWGEWGMIVGPDKATEVATALAPMVGGFTGSTDFGPIITGQLPIFVFTGSSNLALKEKEKGAPIDVLRPFYAYFVSAVTPINGSPSQNLATLFTLFLHTPEGQEVLWEHRRQDSPYIEGTNVNGELVAARASGAPITLQTLDQLEEFEGGIQGYVDLRAVVNELMKTGGG